MSDKIDALVIKIDGILTNTGLASTAANQTSMLTKTDTLLSSVATAANQTSLLTKTDTLLASVATAANQVSEISGINATASSCASIKDKTDLIEEIDKHVHDAHWHSAGHGPSVLQGVSGSVTTASTPPYASAIIQEYACGQDMDGNGKVYGTDFKFTMNDTLPPVFTGAQNNPDFKQSLPEVSWESLRDWSLSNGPNPLV
jgi:hypothetical protein